METEQLKEYLRHVRDLEVACYEQELLLSTLRQKRQSVLNSYVQRPSLPLYTVETHPSCIKWKQEWETQDTENFNGTFISLSVIFVVCVILVLGFYFDIWMLLLLGLPIGVVILLLSFLIVRGMDTVASPKRTAQRQEICLQKVSEDNALIQEKNQRITNENSNLYTHTQAIAASYSSSIEQLTQLLQDTQSKRELAYSKKIIFKKYLSTPDEPHKGLVPITMFCEYLESGMCDSLTGPNGAYVLYENHLRMDLIIENLQIIQTQLSRIEKNQYMLAQEIRSVNATVQAVSTAAIKEINDGFQRTQKTITENAAISHYYEQEIARNAQYQTWMQYMKF